MKNKCISPQVTFFHGRQAPEEGFLEGYGAIIENFSLSVTLPAKLTLISQKKRKYETDGWMVFPPKYKTDNTLYRQLVFALKYEGINLLIFKKLFESIDHNELAEIVQMEPTSQYSRRIWFCMNGS